MTQTAHLVRHWISEIQQRGKGVSQHEREWLAERSRQLFESGEISDHHEKTIFRIFKETV